MKIEAEKRVLQEELTRIESRATKLELQRLSLEGDLQRLQMVLSERDMHFQVTILVLTTPNNRKKFRIIIFELFTETRRKI